LNISDSDQQINNSSVIKPFTWFYYWQRFVIKVSKNSGRENILSDSSLGHMKKKITLLCDDIPLAKMTKPWKSSGW